MTEIELFNEDCLNGMNQLETNKFDLLLTDPPYGIAQSKEADKKVKRWRGGKILTSEWDKFESKEAFNDFTKNWMKEAYRLLRPKGWFCVWCMWKNIPDFIKFGEELGLKYMNLFTWTKTNAAISFPIALTYSCEYVLVFYKSSLDSSFGKYLNSKRIRRDYIVQPTISNKERQSAGGHPTAKPININSIFIEHFTKENDWVLDAFSGSGTTAVCCHRLNRNCVGFEKDKDYYETSLKRIKIEKSQRGIKEWLS